MLPRTPSLRAAAAPCQPIAVEEPTGYLAGAVKKYLHTAAATRLSPHAASAIINTAYTPFTGGSSGDICL